MKFLCEQCKAKYQIADDKVVGKTVRMKCRKCGHLIEVRAAVTESSVASVPPPAPTAAPSTATAPRPGAKPAPPRATPLAASLAASRAPVSRPERPPSALAGAFKSNVQKDDEISAPFDMSELAPGDDWYVAVNGVPVGPIRIAEVRRKAALGAVTEDSLVWQEGLDEWRPLRTFPELAATVREAAASGRVSMTPPPAEARMSLGPPPRGVSLRPVATTAPQAPARVSSQRPNPLVAPVAARSNVVAITSRLATAERLEAPAPTPAPQLSPFVAPAPAAMSSSVPAPVADPFQIPPAPIAPNPAALAPADRDKRGPPWIVIGMLAAFVAFGIASAVLLFGPRAPAPAAPAPEASHAAPSAAPSATAPPSATAEVLAPPPSAGAAPTKVAQNGGARSFNASPAAPTSTGRSLDLHGLSGGTIAPTDDMAGEGPKAAGQCFSEGQVAQVIGQHQVAIRRSCWERNTSTKGSVNVNVSLTIGPDGSPQGVSASGDDLAVAHCIENDVRSWHFPNMGCSQKIAVPFKFVRQ